jgi:hypothetical protein
LRARLDAIGKGVLSFSNNNVATSKKSVGTVDPVNGKTRLAMTCFENCAGLFAMRV